MEEGWIKLHRRFLKWEWIDSPETAHLFVVLLLMANHEGEKWHGMTIRRGQVLTSLGKLSESTGLSVRQIRTALTRLQQTDEISVETTSRFSIVTINKYDGYQDREDCVRQTNDTQATNQRHASDIQATTNKNDKNNINNTLNAPAREDWRFISSVRRTMLGNDKNRIAEHKISLFRSEVESIAPELGMTPQQIDAFVRWWTEHSPGNEKIRAEFEIAFDTKSRMQNWMARDKPRIQTSQPKSRMDQFEENMKFINDFFDGQYQQNAAPDEQ